MDASLKVYIKDERAGIESQSIAVRQETNDPIKAVNNATPKTAEAIKNIKSSKGMAIASMIGSRAFSYTTSNVGKFTGNSRAQDTTNNALQVVSLGAITYANPYIAAATIAIQLATTASNNSWDMKNDQYRVSMERAKAGYGTNGKVVGRRH